MTAIASASFREKLGDLAVTLTYYYYHSQQCNVKKIHCQSKAALKKCNDDGFSVCLRPSSFSITAYRFTRHLMKVRGPNIVSQSNLPKIQVQ